MIPLLVYCGSLVQTELAAAINSSLKSKQIARAFSELRCTFGGRSIIPDISVFARPNIPRQENGRVANTFSRLKSSYCQ